MRAPSSRVKIAGVAIVQALLVAVAVAPQLSARLTGETYQLHVSPVDPIDPFRGAYVTLDYPDLQPPDDFDHDGGTVFVTLAEQDGVMVATDFSHVRPDAAPYLACHDAGWRLRCGIESLFLPQDEAARMQDVVRDGALAKVRIDGRGHAALLDVVPSRG